jgi:hypothetical protein
MSKALKDIIVPLLREHGFKGSFPHLLRHIQNLAPSPPSSTLPTPPKPAGNSGGI